MNLPGFSVGRPIFTSMVMLIVVVLGTASLIRLKVDLFPSIELPTVSIRVGYEGASPEVVEAQVTQIIEEIVATVPGVEEITSESSEGQCRLRVRFVWGTDIDTAALEVQAKLEDEINELPEEIVRPWVGKFDIESFPVVILGISSAMDPVQMTELIDHEIRYRFARIPGVAQVDLFGGFDREVRVELDRTRLEALGLPLNQILQSLRDANLDRPSGRIEEGRYEVTLRAPAQFRDIGQIRDTVIANREGNVITLGQVAEVLDTYERVTEIDRVNGERGLRVGIRKQAGANTVEVSQAILREIERVNARLSPDPHRGRLQLRQFHRTLDCQRRAVGLVWRPPGDPGVALLSPGLAEHPDHFARHPDLRHCDVCPDLFWWFLAQPDVAGRPGAGCRHDGGQFDRRPGKHLPTAQRRGGTSEDRRRAGRRRGYVRPSWPAP